MLRRAETDLQYCNVPGRAACLREARACWIERVSGIEHARASGLGWPRATRPWATPSRRRLAQDWQVAATAQSRITSQEAVFAGVAIQNWGGAA